MEWHWQEDAEPGDPQQNMDMDAALLSALAEGRADVPAVRVYTWSRNAVSLGRLQSEGPVRALYPDLPLVRRPTGGRAVLHGGDLTITAASRLAWLPPGCRSVTASHDFFVEPVRAALEAAGIAASYGGCPLGSQKNIVNCFDLAASCDLIDGLTGRKLVGSAQRREGDAVLQQMSLSLTLLTSLPLFLARLHDEFQKIFRQIDPHFAV